MINKAKLNVEFGELQPIIEWCECNCKSTWGYGVLYTAGKEKGEYEFHFSDEADYINFILWQK